VWRNPLKKVLTLLYKIAVNPALGILKPFFALFAAPRTPLALSSPFSPFLEILNFVRKMRQPKLFHSRGVE